MSAFVGGASAGQQSALELRKWHGMSQSSRSQPRMVVVGRASIAAEILSSRKWCISGKGVPRMVKEGVAAPGVRHNNSQLAGMPRRSVATRASAAAMNDPADIIPSPYGDDDDEETRMWVHDACMQGCMGCMGWMEDYRHRVHACKVHVRMNTQHACMKHSLIHVPTHPSSGVLNQNSTSDGGAHPHHPPGELQQSILKPRCRHRRWPNRAPLSALLCTARLPRRCV